VRERTPKAPPRLNRSANDDELGAALVRHAGDLLAEQPRARANDLAAHADAVRARHGRGGVEPAAQLAQLSVEPCVERQLPLDDERRDEDDPRAAFRGEPACEVERVIRLLPIEQRHDDRPIRDRTGATREPSRSAEMEVDVGQSHLTSG